MRILVVSIAGALALVAALVLALRPGADRDAVATAANVAVDTPGAAQPELSDATPGSGPREDLVESAPIGDGRQPTPVLAAPSTRTPEPVTGRVLGGRTGATPLAGAHVTARRGSHAPRTGTTDAAGRFAVEMPEMGPCFLQISADEHGDVVEAVLPSRDRVVDFVLPLWRDVAVQLTDGGEPIRDWTSIGVHPAFARMLYVRVGVRGARERGELDAARSHGPKKSRPGAGGERAGRFQLTAYARPDDVVHVLLGERVVASAPLPDGNELDVAIDAKAVRAAASPAGVRVLSRAGDAPVAGARVAFEFDQREIHAVETDLDGHARWGAAPPLLLHVRVTGFGFATETSQVREPRDELVEVRVARGWRLAGRLVPAREGYVVAWSMSADGSASGKQISARVNEHGEFEFGGIPAGRYVLSSGRRLAADATIESVASMREFVVVDLEHGDALDVRVPWDERWSEKTKGYSFQRGAR